MYDSVSEPSASASTLWVVIINTDLKCLEAVPVQLPSFVYEQ